jgi:hypothetical protein
MPLRISSESRNLLLLAGVLNAVLIGLAVLELIPAFNGLPYDSAIYADITRKLVAAGVYIRLDSYYMQRLFPSAIVGGFAKLLQVPVSRTYLIDAFRLLDLAAINLTAVCVAESLRINGITGRSRILALILGFGNFCFLKYALYFPVLTDSMAICIAACILYAYYRRASWLVLMLGVIGAFTHPLLIFMAGALFVYPATEPGIYVPPNALRRLSWLPYAGAIAYITGCICAYVFAYQFIIERVAMLLAPVNLQLYFFSAAVGAAYVYIILRLAVHAGLPERLLRGVRKGRLMLTLLLIVLIKLFQYSRATGPGPLNARKYVLNVILDSLTQPAQFLIAHISFLGPIVLFVIILFPLFRKELAKQGTGFIAVLIALLLLMLNSESRQCSLCLPFLLMPVAASLNKSKHSATQLAAAAGAAFLISKIWLPVNVGSPASLKDPQRLNQRFFLNMGPWMIWQAYLIQLVVYAATGVLLFILFRKRRPAFAG